MSFFYSFVMHLTQSPDWAKQLLLASRRSSPDEEAAFLSLVDAAENNITPFVAETLMRTFSDEPDYGTQERVCSVLASGEPATFIKAMLQEMPRLVRETPEWAETLLTTELEFRSDLVCELLRSASSEIRAAVLTITSNPDFLAFQPNAVPIQRICSGNSDA